MIWQARPDDENAIIEMTVRFNERYFDIPINIGKLSGWFHTHMQHGVIFRSEQGFISALHFPDPVRDHTVLTETAWYSEGRDGLRLLRTLIQYGKDRQFDEVRVSTLNTTDAAVLTMLDRMGFLEIERSHRLVI